MFSKYTATRRNVRGAVKATRRTLNRALDAAEPRLEAAAIELQDLSHEAARVVRSKSREGLSELKSGYGKLERKVRRRVAPTRTRNGAKAALLAAGVAAIAVVLLK